MSTNPEQDALRERWALEARIPLSGVADGAVWRRARSVATGEDVVLFIVRGEAALEAADAVRRAYLVDDPPLRPVRDSVVLDDPREESEDPAGHTAGADCRQRSWMPVPPRRHSALRPAGRRGDGAIMAGRDGSRDRAATRGAPQFLDSNRVFVDTLQR